MSLFNSVIIIQCFTTLSGSINHGYNSGEHGWNKQGNQSGIDVEIFRQTKQFLSSLSTIKEFGENGSGYKNESRIQDFHHIRQQCLDEGYLFEDPEFPATDSSLFYSKKLKKVVEWKRPTKIAHNPKLFVDGFSRFDVQQGELGNCWFLAATANLAMHPNLFLQVIPVDQSFEENYAGIFHFKFWQYGRWVEVVIDDRLPTYNGTLLFSNSPEPNEFWSALLEKAYAKLHGSYEALVSGNICEAIVDFTGGVSIVYNMTKKLPPNLFNILLEAYERKSIMGSSLKADPNVLEAKTPQGLIRGHEYSITQVKYFHITTANESGRIPLLRLRNPWGNKAEWNGPWNDKSPNWKFISDEERYELGLVDDHDGEFWMSFYDFKRIFTKLQICQLKPDSLTEDELNPGKQQWEMSVSEGKWVKGVTAGGCTDNLEKFWHNPQYRIMLEYPDEGEDMCTIVIALMQKNRRAQKRMGAASLYIGFYIYSLEDPDSVPKPLDLNFFKNKIPFAKTLHFIDSKEVSGRLKLPPGNYCIVPSTFNHNEEGEFLLRIFSKNKIHMEEYDESVGYGDIDDRVLRHSEPDPNEDEMQEVFKKFAGDDMKCDGMELKKFFDYAMQKDNERLSNDICKNMIAMLDIDHSGQLGFEDFKTLWSDIRNWRTVFRLYDVNGTGDLSTFDLRQALNSAGYILNNHILYILVRRYGTEDGKITFDNFIMCAVSLKAMIGMNNRIN